MPHSYTLRYPANRSPLTTSNFAPEFYVFYNGDEHCPPEEILKLSDLYLEKTATPLLELYVRIININLPEGHALLEQCRPLYEYSWFIQRIKEYLSAGLERDNAITLAIKDCQKAGELCRIEFSRFLSEE